MEIAELSLVIPVYNAAARLPGTLAAIDAFWREHMPGVEIVFVDDCSTDGASGPALDEFARRRACVTVLHNATNRGKGYSVARGILKAQGRYRVFIDVDLA